MRRTPHLVIGKLAALAALACTPFLLAQEPAKQPARLRIFVPANAIVEIDGARTRQTGEERTFASPPLDVTKTYRYTIKATWTNRAGEEVVKEETVRVVGGEETVLDLRPSIAPKTTGKTPPRLDAPYVPTPQDVVEKMLQMANVTDKDVVYDLGCGDGRIVVTAAKNYQAKGVGIDLNPVRVRESLDNVKKGKVDKLVEIREGDILKVADLGKATVVTLYLLPDVNEKLKPIIQKQCKPGTRIVMHDFDMEDWVPAKEESVTDSEGNKHNLYLYELGTEEPKKKPADKKEPEPKKAAEKKEPEKKAAEKKEPEKKEQAAEPRKPDVVYVPTPQDVVEKMLEMAKVTKDDVVFDLGCGDGRIPVTAARKYGAKGVGIDIDPERVKESLANVKKNKVEKLVDIRAGDVFKVQDLGKATVITLYLLSELNEKLMPIIQKQCKPGTRIVTHDFAMGNWTASKELSMKGDDGNDHDVYLYVLGQEAPAKKPEKVVPPEPVKKKEDLDRDPDILYVPTAQGVVDKMLEMAKVTKNDVVWDLGCGDCRIPVTAAKKYGCKARGFDIDPARIKDSEENIKKNKMENLVTVQRRDIFTLDLSKEPTVITLYLYPNLNVKLIPQLDKLPKGARIVSHDFNIEGVEPDQVVTMKAKSDSGAEREHTIYLFSVPLKKTADKKEKEKENLDREPDILYVPTAQAVVDKMLEMAKVTKNDVVWDLGCGDCRIPVTAAKKYGCKARGFDIDPARIKDSEENIKKNKVGDLVSVQRRDVFTLDLSKEPTVITLYLLPRLNVKLIPQLEKLPKGARIVSHDFDMEGVKPDQVVKLRAKNDEGFEREHTIYLWTVPLKKEEKNGAKEDEGLGLLVPGVGSASEEVVVAAEDKKEDKKEKRPDVIYVPTPQAVVDKMLDMAKVKKDDVVWDLGCGDGRIPVTAAKKLGCKARGFDVDPDRIKESLENVKKNKVEDLVKIEQKDIFTLDLSKEPTVVTLYLLPRLNVKLIPQLDKLPKGARIVSHDFDMEGVKPDKVERITAKDDDGNEAEHTIYLWTVPLNKEKK